MSEKYRNIDDIRSAFSRSVHAADDEHRHKYWKAFDEAVFAARTLGANAPPSDPALVLEWSTKICYCKRGQETFPGVHWPQTDCEK